MFHLNHKRPIALLLASLTCLASRAEYSATEKSFIDRAGEFDEKTIELISDKNFEQQLFDSYKKPTKKEELASKSAQFIAIFCIHYGMRNFSEASLHVYENWYSKDQQSDYVIQALTLSPLLFAWVMSANAQEKIAKECRTQPSRLTNIAAWLSALLAPSIALGTIKYFGLGAVRHSVGG